MGVITKWSLPRTNIVILNFLCGRLPNFLEADDELDEAVDRHRRRRSGHTAARNDWKRSNSFLRGSLALILIRFTNNNNKRYRKVYKSFSKPLIANVRNSEVRLTQRSQQNERFLFFGKIFAWYKVSFQFWNWMNSLFPLLALWGNKNWLSSMKAKKLENF